MTTEEKQNKDNFEAQMYIPTRDERHLVSYLERQFDERLANMRERHRQWILNFAIEQGKQWHTYSRTARKIIEVPSRNPDKLRVTLNLIEGSVSDTLGMLTQSDPRVEIVPSSFSQHDKETATSARVHIERIHDDIKKDELDAELWTLVLMTGVGFRFIYWDPMKGENIYIKDSDYERSDSEEEGRIIDAYEASSNEVKDKNITKALKSIGKVHVLKTGDVNETIIPPWNILLEQSVIKDSHINNFIWFRLVDLKDIRNTWVKGKYVKEEGIQGNTLSELFSGVNEHYKPMETEHAVILKSKFQLPDSEFPEGRVIHWANGVILYDGPLQHPDRKLCLIPYHWKINPLSFWNTSYVEQLIEPNVIVNRVLTALNQWLMEIAKFRAAVPRGSKISKVNVSGVSTGTVLEYTPIAGVPWQNIDIPEAPSTMWRMLDNVISIYDRIAHSYEVNRGQRAPGRVEAGFAINQLQEASTQFLATPLRLYEIREKEAIRIYLEFMQDKYLEDREAKILGESRETEVYTLIGRDLSTNIDIKIVKGSALPRSKIGQNAYVMELVNNGLLGDPSNDPEARRKVLKMLELTGLEDVWGDNNIGFSQQQYELKQFAKGGDAKVEPWHDHYASNIVLLRHMNSRAFREQPDQYKQKVIQHWQEHAQALVARL